MIKFALSFAASSITFIVENMVVTMAVTFWFALPLFIVSTVSANGAPGISFKRILIISCTVYTVGGPEFFADKLKAGMPNNAVAPAVLSAVVINSRLSK